MADMGFLPEVRRILDKVRDDRQTLLFSATLDGDVDVLIKHYQHNPAHHEAVSMEVQGEVTHRFWACAQADKIHVATADRRAVAGRRSCSAAPSTAPSGIAKQLNKAGVRAEAIHGDRSQSQRERALGLFQQGKVNVLVATDVAARGIHVDDVALVLQFDPPAVDKDYVHRSGRTGRAGAAGTVITLVTPEKEKDVRKLQRELRRREPIEAATAATAAEVLGRHRAEAGRPRRRPRRREPPRAGPRRRPAPSRRPTEPRLLRDGRRPGPSRAASRTARAERSGNGTGRRVASRAATVRSARVHPPALVARAQSPADDPLVQEPPARAAPPAATHADARRADATLVPERSRDLGRGCAVAQGPDGVDEVDVVWVLVGAVALHPREPQRDAARVAGARLHAVERDLHDELGPHEHRRCPRGAPRAPAAPRSAR